MGDKSVDLSNVPNDLATTIVGTTDCLIRYQIYSGGTHQRIQGYSDDLNYTASSASTTNNGSFSLTINGYETSYTFNNGTTKTSTVSDGFYIDPDGDYILKYSSSPAYIKENDSVIVLSGQTDNIALYGSGTVDSGLSFDNVFVESNTVSYGEVSFNYTDVNGYIDLISLSSCVFDRTLTNSDNETSTSTLTYSYFVVPYEVTAERSVHPDESMGVILDIIPLVIGVGLLLLTVAWFLGRKF